MRKERRKPFLPLAVKSIRFWISAFAGMTKKGTLTALQQRVKKYVIFTV
jgi:hypothetical protein